MADDQLKDSSTTPAPPAASLPRGTQAVVGVVVAVVGAMAAVYPTSALFKALGDWVPQLATVLPVVVTAVGAIIAALSHPPDIPRRNGS